MRSASLIGRIAAVAAIAIAIVAVAVILLSSGSTYQVRAIFQNASQIVQGDLVQVAGNSVGTVSEIAITPQRAGGVDAEDLKWRLRAAAPGDDRDDP